MPTATHWIGWLEPSIRIPKLVPLFPIGPFDPMSPCGHKKRIKRGSSFICMVCHQTGWEQHPDLKIKSSDMPATEGKEETPASETPRNDQKPWVEMTRKERRAIMFGAKEPNVSPSADPAVASDAAPASFADRETSVDPSLASCRAALSGGDFPV
jgi:hypothetical protein